MLVSSVIYLLLMQAPEKQELSSQSTSGEVLTFEKVFQGKVTTEQLHGFVQTLKEKNEAMTEKSKPIVLRNIETGILVPTTKLDFNTEKYEKFDITKLNLNSNKILPQFSELVFQNFLSVYNLQERAVSTEQEVKLSVKPNLVIRDDILPQITKVLQKKVKIEKSVRDFNLLFEIVKHEQGEGEEPIFTYKLRDVTEGARLEKVITKGNKYVQYKNCVDTNIQVVEELEQLGEEGLAPEQKVKLNQLNNKQDFMNEVSLEYTAAQKNIVFVQDQEGKKFSFQLTHRVGSKSKESIVLDAVQLKIEAVRQYKALTGEVQEVKQPLIKNKEKLLLHEYSKEQLMGYAINKVLVSQMKDADVSDKILHDFSGKVQQLNICMELLNGKDINKLIDGNRAIDSDHFYENMQEDMAYWGFVLEENKLSGCEEATDLNIVINSWLY